MATYRVKYEFRTGTSSQWSSADPTLREGEPGWEKDTNKLKIGDGSTPWSGLSYFSPGGGGGGTWGSITGTLSDQTDLNTELNNKLEASDLVSYITSADAASTYQPLSAVLTATTASFTIAKDTKLTGIAAGATVNSSDATLLARANHTGTQLAATISDFNTAADARVTAGLAGYITSAAVAAGYQPLDPVLTATTASFTTAKDTKLSGIATGATANSSDATLLARANHTGTQLAATISDFNTAADARVSAGLVGYLTSAAAAAAYQPLDADLTTWAGVTPGTGITTALGINVGTAGSVVVNGGALGTPSSGNLANCTFPTLNQNTTGSAATLTTGRTIGITGDVTWTSPSFNGSGNVTAAATVTRINGVALSALATGILKNTTTTGVPSIAVAADFPTLNQSTTGSAATLTTGRTIGMTGDVVWTSSSFNGSGNVTGTSAIQANVVTNAMLSTMATATFKGRTTAGVGNVEDLTATQATALLNIMGAASAGAGGLKGLTPATAAGDQVKFLRGDATWASIPGGGDLLSTNNLSDVANTTTARNNLGAAPTASPTFTGTVTIGARIDFAGAKQFANLSGGYTSFTDPEGNGRIIFGPASSDTNNYYDSDGQHRFRTAGGVTWGVVHAMDFTSYLDDAYDATTWNGSLKLPTKNAVRDKIETLVPNTRTLTTTAPLTIGGGASADLSADRTLAISAATQSAAGSMSATDKIKADAQLAALTGLSGAFGAAIGDYFSSTVSLEASSTYEITCHAYFLKTTAGTAQFQWNFSSAPTMATSRYQMTPVTGFTTSVITGAEVFAEATQQASTTLIHAASASLTSAVYHSVFFTLIVRTNAATTLQLRVTQSAGTLTPQAGSYIKPIKVV